MRVVRKAEHRGDSIVIRRHPVAQERLARKRSLLPSRCYFETADMPYTNRAYFVRLARVYAYKARYKRFYKKVTYYSWSERAGRT